MECCSYFLLAILLPIYIYIPNFFILLIRGCMNKKLVIGIVVIAVVILVVVMIANSKRPDLAPKNDRKNVAKSVSSGGNTAAPNVFTAGAQPAKAGESAIEKMFGGKNII